MSAVRVKICGVRDPDELDLAVDAGADAIGLLCSVPVDSPREISTERAAQLASRTPPFVTAVLVTMADTVQKVEELVEAVEPDAVQVHGGLDPEAAGQLSDRLPVIRAVDVQDEDDVRAHAKHVSAILLDSTDEQGAGGTGRTHDWNAAAAIVEELETPVLLAGGLTPDNVAAAVDRVRPYAVDVASGVDGADGKDPTAVRSFVAAAGRGNGGPGP